MRICNESMQVKFESFYVLPCWLHVTKKLLAFLNFNENTQTIHMMSLKNGPHESKLLNSSQTTLGSVVVAPYSCGTNLYRSVWSFADRQKIWNEQHMKSCVLRFFHGEITKCSVHDKKFVKPKQYVCFQQVFSVFRPRFRKLLRLAFFSSVFRMSTSDSKFYPVSNDFMDFNLDYPLFPSVDFLKLRPVVVPYLR